MLGVPATATSCNPTFVSELISTPRSDLEPTCAAHPPNPKMKTGIPMSRHMFFATLATFAFFLAGCSGPHGPEGPPGGLSGYETVVSETAIDGTPDKQLRVDCPGGKRATGAGWSALDGTGAILSGRATYSQPAFDGSHWIINARNDSEFESSWMLRVRVICVDA